MLRNLPAMLGDGTVIHTQTVELQCHLHYTHHKLTYTSTSYITFYIVLSPLTLITTWFILTS